MVGDFLHAYKFSSGKMPGGLEIYTFINTPVVLFLLEYFKWKNMVLFIFGMIENTKDITLDVVGEMRKMVIFVHQHG
jgi:hypothetical protein